jgi:hypothetical protein
MLSLSSTKSTLGSSRQSWVIWTNSDKNNDSSLGEIQSLIPNHERLLGSKESFRNQIGQFCGQGPPRRNIDPKRPERWTMRRTKRTRSTERWTEESLGHGSIIATIYPQCNGCTLSSLGSDIRRWPSRSNHSPMNRGSQASACQIRTSQWRYA